MRAGDLEAARELARAGVPLFMAEPDPRSRTGYRLPVQWERGARADPALVDALPEGWALCAVMGHGLDLVDLDPRNGVMVEGTAPGYPELPPALAIADTPSGGRHLFVLSLGLPSLDGVAPGLDYKGGDPTGNGRGFAFIAPTIRVSKADGRPHPYRWVEPPDGRLSGALRAPNPVIIGENLRRAIAERREQRTEGIPRVVPASVASREWRSAVERLEVDLRRWVTSGWGGEAHAGLLAHTTHLARLSPEHAEEAYRYAFERAGVVPDPDDWAKLESALEHAVPDVVVSDAELSAQELFWAGGSPEVVRDPDPRPGPEGEGSAPEGTAFEFCDPSWLEHPPAPPEPSYGAFGGPRALFYAEGVHWLQGESESGKTWVALALVLEVLRAGGRVLLVDHEDTRDGVLGRLRDLGVTPGEVARLVYVSGQDVRHAELVEHLATTDRGYALAVVDGVTSALSAANLSGRDEQELTRWADAVPRRARMAVVVDHVVKSPDERNGMAIGSQAKKSVVTGTSFEVRCAVKFGRGTSGQLELRLQKDKRGGVRGRVRPVVRLRFASDPATGAVSISTAAPGGPATADELFLGASLPAEVERRAEELCALMQAAGWSADLTANTLAGRLKSELNQSAARTTKMRAVHLFKAAAGLPVDVSRPPVEDDDDGA